MSVQVSCHHGHTFDVTEDFKGPPEIVCPHCGSLTKFKPSGEITREGWLDVTIDSHAGGHSGVALPGDVSEPSNTEELGSGDGSKFVTMEYAAAADRAGRGSSDDEARKASASSASGQHQQGSGSGSNGKRKDVPFEPPSLAGYQIMEELGRGGMGVVYRAHAAALGHDVALKTLQRMSPYGLRRFKQEFRSLADISHPNLATLYELLSDGATWCFTMEVLKGVEFLEYVWSGFETMNVDSQTKPARSNSQEVRLSAERLKRLEDALTQLVSGLSSLHEFGMLHSDIKPSNVLMTTDGRLVLLDFGLVAELRREEGAADSKTIQGTPQYMSPEQAEGERLSAASDWYAVGVMLYEVLTGRLPFCGPTMQILSQKRMQEAVKPLDLENVPRHLNDLCVALLDRAPHNRPSAVEILQSIGADRMAKNLIPSKRTAAMRSVELVGRERHMEVLRQSFREVSAGNTRSVFISGQSGMGKSVLVNSFLDNVKSRHEAVILSGRCYEQESVPFKALDNLIDSLAVFLGALPEEVVHSVMPRDRLALTRVFPVLGGTPEVANATYPSIENADQQELRQRAMNAMRELLQRLAIREPLVLYIDDLQWGDVDSAGLLADLVRPPEMPRMLVLGSYRTENLETSVCLRALDTAYTTGQHHPHREEIAVDSLPEPDAKHLALLLLGRDDEESHALAAKIARESGGQPFFVWELAQHVQDDPDIGDQSLELDEVIWRRVNRLPEEVRRLLELFAVSSRPTPATEAYQAVDAVEDGPRYLAQLRTSNFVRTTESEDEEDTIVETYHDRIRESVVAHLDEETVQGHNLKLAITIEQVSGIQVDDLWAHINSTPEFEEPGQPFSFNQRQWQRVFDLSSFFDAGGEPQRAFPFALCAAEQAREQDAQEVAEQQYRVALRGAAGVSPAIRFRVLEGLGDVFVLRGKYDEANAQFEATRSLVKDKFVLARLDWKRGVAAFKKGDMGDSRDYSEKALTALGERPPSALTALPRALAEAIVQVLHTKFPSRFVGQRDPNSANGKMDLFRARVYDQLTFSYWFAAGMNFVLWSHLRQMNLAERYPPSPELGKTYAFHAVTMTGLPMAKRGIAYAERAYQISVDDGDLWGQGRARCYHTFACIVLGRFHEGVKTGDEAVELLEQAGDVWEANMARMIATVPRFHLGDLKSAYLESKKAYEIAIECGDFSGVCISLVFWAPCSPHTLPSGAIQKEMERDREDPVTLAAVAYARGLELLLCEDNPREAAVVLEECLKRARKRGVRNVCIFSATTWKATALRIAAEREREPSARRLVLRAAKRAAKAALGITKSYVASRSHALREAGLIAVIEGRESFARECFEKSLSVAEQYDARYDIAKTNLAYGEAAVRFGWPDGEQRVAPAKATIQMIEDFQR